jgi:hypothetical protein
MVITSASFRSAATVVLARRFRRSDRSASLA